MMNDTVLSDTELSEKCKRLEQQLKKCPKSARRTSELAFAVAEKGRRSTSEEKKRDLLSEALSLAQRAVELNPNRPFGYAALSMIDPDFKQRMKSLRRAAELSSSPEHVFARVKLYVRLLLEPRKEESRRVRGVIGTASLKHPNRRHWNDDESSIYQCVRDALHDAWSGKGGVSNLSTKKPSREEIEFLAFHEYRIGMFFRKMEPREVHRSHSQHHFRQVCENLPESDSLRTQANFWLATLDPTTNIEKCPKEYIEGLYSTFAARFDTLLIEKLAYVTPTELRRLVDDFVVAPRADGTTRKGADLGCGTGLSGLAFRDCVDHLIGVDLSEQMIDKARLRKCYDKLVVGDVTTVLVEADSNFDLIVACDVFVYLGDLSEVFSLVHSSLSNQGIFGFSTESLLKSNTNGDRPYVLQECARFAHSKEYIEQLASENSFEICAMKSSVIRRNQGKDVVGLLVVMKKKLS